MIGRSEGQGALQETGNPLDLAIEGPGYFQVTPRRRPDLALTRDGAFGVDASGTIVERRGQPPRARRSSSPRASPPSELRIAQRRHGHRAGKQGSARSSSSR